MSCSLNGVELSPFRQLVVLAVDDDGRHLEFRRFRRTRLVSRGSESVAQRLRKADTGNEHGRVGR